jgi:hypothetical protein
MSHGHLMGNLTAIYVGQHIKRARLHQCAAVGGGIQGMQLPGPRGRDLADDKIAHQR